MMKQLIHMVVENVLPTVATAIGGLLSAFLAWVLFKAKQWLDVRVKNDKINSTLKRMADAAADIVRDVSAIEYKKAIDLAQDGKLDANDRAKLRQTAVDRLKTYLGPKALEDLGANMKVGAEALETILAAKVEHAVDQMKLTRVAAANANPVAVIATTPK